MRLVPILGLIALLLAGCAGGTDATGTTPERTTPANSPNTTGGGTGSTSGNAPGGTGQNNPSTYGADSGSQSSSLPGTDAARP